jgi:glutamyl-tRNA reductase
MSAAFAAVKLAEQIFGKPKNHSALMVGAGAMGEQIVEHLRERGASRILICNRTRPRAAALAAKVGGEVVEWEELPRSLALPDMAVVSVQGEQAIVTSAMLQRALEARHGRPLFIVDLSVPRAVEEAAGRLNNIYLYNVDDLAGIVEQNRQARMEEIPRAERIIEEQLKRFRAWQAGSECASLVPELRARLRQEGDRVQREDLPELEHLSPEERQRARRAARPLRNAADLER